MNIPPFSVRLLKWFYLLRAFLGVFMIGAAITTLDVKRESKFWQGFQRSIAKSGGFKQANRT